MPAIQTSADEVIRSSWINAAKHKFTGDDIANLVIDAYKKGRNDERERVKMDLAKQLNKINEIVDKVLGTDVRQLFLQSFQAATSEAERVYLDIHSKYNIPLEVFLRPDGLYQFSALYLVPEEFFLSDQMMELYELIAQRLNELEERPVSLDFKFMPVTEYIDKDAIALDGYSFSYNRTHEEPSPS
jgi:hypothetical protein